jgi:hypothetical protein
VLSAGIDGVLRCHSVVLQEGYTLTAPLLFVVLSPTRPLTSPRYVQLHRRSATTTQTWEVLRENFPLQAMATASNFGHSLVAVGGMGHKIHLLIRGARVLHHCCSPASFALHHA